LNEVLTELASEISQQPNAESGYGHPRNHQNSSGGIQDSESTQGNRN